MREFEVVHYHYPGPESIKRKQFFVPCDEVGSPNTIVNFVCKKCKLPVAYFRPDKKMLFAPTKNVGISFRS